MCCEDTRRTGRLLQHAGVRAARLAVCNEHTEAARIAEVLDVLAAGGDVAVVTDAGTPGISDPGERLVAAVVAAGHDVTAVPGPAAFVTALVISGLPTARFVFEGFLPAYRAGAGASASPSSPPSAARSCCTRRRTACCARSPTSRHALGADRRVVVTRELTKLHETVVRGALGASTSASRGASTCSSSPARPPTAPATGDEVRARGARRPRRRRVDA